jgi:hypothetical protein
MTPVLMSLGYKMNITLRCESSSAVKAAVRLGMGAWEWESHIETLLPAG